MVYSTSHKRPMAQVLCPSPIAKHDASIADRQTLSDPQYTAPFQLAYHTQACHIGRGEPPFFLVFFSFSLFFRLLLSSCPGQCISRLFLGEGEFGLFRTIIYEVPRASLRVPLGLGRRTSLRTFEKHGCTVLGKAKSILKVGLLEYFGTSSPDYSRRSDNRTLFCQTSQEVAFEEPVKRHSCKDS